MTPRGAAAHPEVVTVTPNPALDWALAVPDFMPGAVNRVTAERLTAGGKGINVAAALAGYGHRVAVTGLLGDANAGEFDALFARAGIRDECVRVRGNTRVAIKITDPTRRQTTDVNAAGPPATADDLARLLARVAALAAAPTPWFVLAGSLPPGVPPTLYRDLVRTLTAAGHSVVLDASGDALRHALDALPAEVAAHPAPTVLKPNVHELEALVGRPLPTRDAVAAVARAYLARGVELVAVSLGEDGALFVGRDAIVLARPPQVAVRTTVGAGDAMVAGILAGRLRGLPFDEVARLATAFAVHAIADVEPGASPAAAIDALRDRVEVRDLG
ncbi:1-phosphofructokinase [Gemmatimonadetes bacterium T265]|nr:1-phosphofructokinase [Gemmatimonadetes bacterium T265]